MHRPDSEDERRIQREEARRERHDAHGAHPRRPVGPPPLVPDRAPEESGRDHVPAEPALAAGEAREAEVPLAGAARPVDEERVGEAEGGRGSAGGAVGLGAAIVAGEVRPWLEHDGDGGARDVDREDYVDYSLVRCHDCGVVTLGRLLLLVMVEL